MPFFAVLLGSAEGGSAPTLVTDLPSTTLVNDGDDLTLVASALGADSWILEQRNPISFVWEDLAISGSGNSASHTFTTPAAYNGAHHGSVYRFTFINASGAVSTQGTAISVLASSGNIVFTTPLVNVSTVEGTSAAFSWLATAPSGGTITYAIHTEPDTDNWSFGSQTGTTFSFNGLSIADSGTTVQVIASNGIDNSAESRATITVTPADGGGGGGGGGGLDLVNIYFHGHSLMTEGFVNVFTQAGYLGQQLTANGYVYDGIYNNGGADAAQGLTDVTANQSAWISADAIILDYGVNDSSGTTTFKARIKAIADYIHGVDATMHVAVMECHSSSAGTVGVNIQDRHIANNPALAQLAAEGSIDSLIPWVNFAEANKQPISNGGLFYNDDGVHHHYNQGPYIDKMIAHLNELTAVPTPPTGLASRTMGFDNYADLHFGNPYAATTAGNTLIKTNEAGHPFRAVETGTINATAFNLKYNNTNGYSGGTGGKCRVDIYPADTTGRPNGASLGGYSLPDVVAPGESISNGNGWVAKHFMDSNASVTEGNDYCMVVSNYDGSPSSNFFSVNYQVCYPNTTIPPDPDYMAITTGNGYFVPLLKGSSYWNPDGGTTWNDYYGRDDVTSGGAMNWHNCSFEIYYASGNRQGQSYAGTRYGDSYWDRTLTGGSRYRMGILSKRGGRTATHLNLFPGAQRALWPSGSTMSAIVRNSALTQLATCTLSKNGNYWGKGALSSSVAIADNSVYYVDLWHNAGTSFLVRPSHTSLNGHGWEGAGFSDCPGPGMFLSTDSGASYSQPGAGPVCDLGLFFNTTV